MQTHAGYGYMALYKAPGQKKGFTKAEYIHKKAAGRAAAVRINEPDEMLSRNGPASDVLLSVPVVLLVRFPAVAVQ